MNRKLRKYIFIYIIIQIIFMFVLINGCSKKSENKVVKIGVTISNTKDEFISYIFSEMKEAQKSYGDKIEVTYLDAKEDEEKQREQVRYFIEQGMDAIVILPVDTRNTSKITKMLTKAKVPGIYMNRYPDEFMKNEQPEGIYYVGSDERSSGVIQMEYLAELLNGKGDVVILMGELGNNAAIMRTEGVEKVAERYPNINIVGKLLGKWIAPLASSVIEEWIVSGKKIDAVASNNDEMAIGAIRALEKYGKLDDVIVVGIDATRDAIEEIKAEHLKGTVFQNSKTQGRNALEVAFKVVNKQVVTQNTWIPFELVTPENYNKYIQ